MAKVILDWDTKYKKGIIISDFLDVIREHFSIENPDARILIKRLGPWARIDKRKYAITNTGRFEPGLLFDIIRYLKSTNSYEVVVTPLLENEMCCGYKDLKSSEIISLNKTLRPYQELAIKKGLKFGLGTIVVGTAGGKTLVMATLINTLRVNRLIKFKTLIILPAQLIEQTYSDFIEYGILKDDICRWGGDHELEDKDIIIASSKTLETKLTVFRKEKLDIPPHASPDEIKFQKNLYQQEEKERKKKWLEQKKQYLKTLESVDVVLIDEVQGLRKGNTINDTVDNFSTHHRYGFTGTLPESLIDQWNIIGTVGPILEDVPSHQLRDGGYVAKAHATVIKITYKNPPKLVIDKILPIKAYKEECEFLFTNEYRNKVISHLSQKTDNNMLILINSLKHGEILSNKLIAEIPQKKVYYIRGEVPVSEREIVRKVMEEENNVVCVAMSKIFSTGINICNLHYILFALAGKAKIRFLQSIGRGLRLHENKNNLEIFDIVDEVHYSLKHYEGKRAEYYEREKIDYEIKHLSE